MEKVIVESLRGRLGNLHSNVMRPRFGGKHVAASNVARNLTLAAVTCKEEQNEGPDNAAKLSRGTFSKHAGDGCLKSISKTKWSSHDCGPGWTLCNQGSVVWTPASLHCHGGRRERKVGNGNSDRVCIFLLQLLIKGKSKSWLKWLILTFLIISDQNVGLQNDRLLIIASKLSSGPTHEACHVYGPFSERKQTLIQDKRGPIEQTKKLKKVELEIKKNDTQRHNMAALTTSLLCFRQDWKLTNVWNQKIRLDKIQYNQCLCLIPTFDSLFPLRISHHSLWIMKTRLHTLTHSSLTYHSLITHWLTRIRNEYNYSSICVSLYEKTFVGKKNGWKKYMTFFLFSLPINITRLNVRQLSRLLKQSLLWGKHDCICFPSELGTLENGAEKGD